MLAAAVVLLAVACCAAALAVAPVSRPRKAATWWRLDPITPECDVDEAEVAVKRMSARRRKAVATIAHVGSDEGRPGLWLGVSAAGRQQAEGIAEGIAEAGGCRLGEQGAPPKLPKERRRWWTALPEISTVEGGDGTGIGTSPTLHREMLVGFCARFADQVDPALAGGDAWVVSFAPHKGASCAAVAMTTNAELGEAWAGGAQEMWVFSKPSPSGVAAGIAGAAGLLVALAGMGVIGAGGGSGSAAAAGLVGSVVGAAGLWHGWSKPRNVRRLERFWHLPLGRKRSRKGSEWSSVPSALAAGWANGGESTAVQAHQRAAPDQVTVPSGVRVGADEAGRDCFLTYKDRQWGLFCVGDPGTGKTTMLLNLLRGDVLARRQGKEIAALWIETKGEGAERAQQVIRDAGWEPLVISAASSEGTRLELLDWDNPPRSSALLVDAMQYAFEEDDIHAHSVDVLNAVFHSVLAMPPNAAREMGFASGRPDVMQMAWWLLGGDEQGRMPQKARAMAEKHAPLAYAAFADYTPTHRSKRDSEQLTRAPRNKVRPLITCEGLFSGYDRPYVTLGDLIGGHHMVVLDLSPKHGRAYTETTAQQTAALVMFCIWDAIKETCEGWQQAGKSVAIYSDEVRDVAGFGNVSLEVVRALADQGRSRGVLPVFATQRFNQIRPSTREAVTSFGSLVFFRQRDVEVAETASAYLRDAYTIDEVSALEVGRCAARLSYDGVPQPAFTLRPDDL